MSLQQLWKKAIEDGREYDCNRIWQSCHYIVIESTRRRLAGKSCKGKVSCIIMKPSLCSLGAGILLAGILVFKCCVKHCQLCVAVMSS